MGIKRGGEFGAGKYVYVYRFGTAIVVDISSQLASKGRDGLPSRLATFLVCMCVIYSKVEKNGRNSVTNKCNITLS